MTATPLREDNRDTYLYFGNPIYAYSLRQGIDDGFLAPYRVHRVVTDWDAAGWRPSKGELDRYGREIPDDEYQTKDFERVVVAAATHRGHREAPHRVPEEDRPLRQDHRLLRGPGARRRDAAGAQQPERRPRQRSTRTTSAASRPTKATSAAGTSSSFQDAGRRRRRSSSPPRSCSRPASTPRRARTSCSPASSAR